VPKLHQEQQIVDDLQGTAYEERPRLERGRFPGLAGEAHLRTGARSSRPRTRAEPEIAQALDRYLADEGIAARIGLTYSRIESREGEITLTFDVDGRAGTLAAERVLVTTGRSPNTAGLGLDEAGIKQLPTGGIYVDDRMRTSRPGIYAAGDVTGRAQFVYMAAYGAKLAARNALNGDSLVYDNTTMPWVVFTDPQVAGVGLSERQAIQQGFDVKTSVVSLDQVSRALAARDTRGQAVCSARRSSHPRAPIVSRPWRWR